MVPSQLANEDNIGILCFDQNYSMLSIYIRMASMRWF